jgi:hypothetical protein
LHPKALTQHVDGESDFDAEAVREWKGGSERLARQASLAGQRLSRHPAGGALDARPS